MSLKPLWTRIKKRSNLKTRLMRLMNKVHFSVLGGIISIMLVLYAYHQFSHIKALRIMQVLSLFPFLAMDLKINPFILHSLFYKS